MTEPQETWSLYTGLGWVSYSDESVIQFDWILVLAQTSVEDLFAETWQLMAGWRFVSFFTPDMASKNDASYGIG